MNYVVAGYVICLSVLALYAVGLVLRRRHLERAASLIDGPAPDRVPAGTTGPRDRDGGTPDAVPPTLGGER